MADDGGSSGKLRESFGILPPGDIRNCLAALSTDEAMLTQLFQYRFSGSPDLEGHSFGNLFITALADITGSFESAVVESGRAMGLEPGLDADASPYCVRHCLGEALSFGDLDDADSEVSRLIKESRAFRLHEAVATHPAVFYIAANDREPQQEPLPQTARQAKGDGAG